MIRAAVHMPDDQSRDAIRKQDSPDVLAGRIVIALEDPSMRPQIGRILFKAGFWNIQYVTSSAEALRVLREAASPDLLILDVRMSGLDGLELCRLFREQNKLARLPILILSDADNVDEQGRIFGCGASDYVRKPINPPELVARTYRLIADSQKLKRLSDYWRTTRQELQAVRQRQHRLYPTERECDEIGRRYGMSIQAFVKTWADLGGDMIGLKPLDEARLGFFSLDVSGHGLCAAIETFRVHAMIQRLWKSDLSPDGVLDRLNTELAPAFEVGTFITMLCGEFDIRKRAVTYASAAHPSPVLVSNSPEIRVRLCESDGPLLGIDAASTFEAHTLAFGPNDSFLTYSDALIETKDSQGTRLWEGGLKQQIEKYVSDGGDGRYLPALMKDFRKTRAMHLKDDISFLGFRNLGDGSPAPSPF